MTMKEVPPGCLYLSMMFMQLHSCFKTLLGTGTCGAVPQCAQLAAQCHARSWFLIWVSSRTHSLVRSGRVPCGLIHVELLPHEGLMERACLFRMTWHCRSVGGVRRSERPIPSWFALLVDEGSHGVRRAPFYLKVDLVSAEHLALLLYMRDPMEPTSVHLLDVLGVLASPCTMRNLLENFRNSVNFHIL